MSIDHTLAGSLTVSVETAGLEDLRLVNGNEVKQNYKGRFLLN